MSYLQRVHRSLGIWCRYLERPGVAARVVVALLAVHTGLLAYSAYVHSPTLNEPGHLVAGLSHWKFGRFELYRVNPPLVRMVAALPVMAAGYEENWSGFYEGPGARPVFGMGEDFIAANGERSFFLTMIARWSCIPFSWIGGIVCYLWARDLSGRSAGVMACILWCFSPNILAHASLITADAGGAALGLAACYTFWRWLREPTWTQAAITGFVLGLAELCKTTLILFYPLWPLLWVLYRWPDRNRMLGRDWLREAGMLMLRMAIGLYVLNMGYGFENSLKPLGEFHFVSDLFTGQGEVANPEQIGTSGSTANRFAGTWLGNLPVPFPANYLLGIDIQQHDFEDYGRPSYLRGQWQDHGWWYYYLYAALIKVPLGSWALLGLALAATAARFLRRAELPRVPHALSWSDQIILLSPPLVIFVVVSSKTGFNEHFRYILPCFPFGFVWVGAVSFTALKILDKFLDILAKNTITNGKRIIFPLGHGVAAGGFVFLLWSATSSLWIYPHSLSYFNEAIGGPLGGPRHLLGSNIDWGQDLPYIKSFIIDQDKPIRLAYCGAVDPTVLELAMLSEPVRVNGSDLDAVIQGRIAEPFNSTIVISVSLMYGRSDFARCGSIGKYRISKFILERLRVEKHHKSLAYSLYIFQPDTKPR